MKLTHQLLTAVAVLVSSSAAFAVDLSTQTGQEFGLTLSDYTYKEPSLDVKLEGIHIGAEYTTTMSFSNDWFMSLNGRFAYGKPDYSGSGTEENNPNWFVDLRPLFGKDIPVGSAVITPYTGVGYRILKNDNRGITSTDAWGYRRESRYFYLPLGVTHRFALDSEAQLISTLEFDYLLSGNQRSTLSDVPGYPDVDNRQDSGYGFKVSSMYHVNGYSIGPYIDYWNINTSDLDDTYHNYYEPHNTTVEFGIKASMRF